MSDIPYVEPGDLPFAVDYNKLIDTAELAAKGSQDASLGFPPEIEIYELTADPALNEDWNVYTAKAKRVRTQYASSTAGDYVIEDTYPEEDVYFPCPLDNTAPGQSSGDRVSTILIDGKRVMIGGGGGDSIIGYLDTAITATGSATLRIYTGTPGSESDSGNTVTVYNWGAGALADETKVIAAKANGYYYISSVLPKTSSITVQTAEQWDGTNHLLQNKTRTVDSINPGTESGWMTIDTADCATACP